MLSFCVFVISLVAAVYVGLFVLFIPGLADVINQFSSENVDGLVAAIGITKCLVAWPVAWFTFAASIFVLSLLTLKINVQTIVRR